MGYGRVGVVCAGGERLLLGGSLALGLLLEEMGSVGRVRLPLVHGVLCEGPEGQLLRIWKGRSEEEGPPRGSHA